MTFIPNQYFLNLLRTSGVPFRVCEGGILRSSCIETENKFEELNYYTQYKISQNLLFKYFLGLINIQVYSLRGNKRQILKGRIIGTNGAIIRSISASTKTRIYTYGYKFIICGTPEGVTRAYRMISKIGSGRSYGVCFGDL